MKLTKNEKIPLAITAVTMEGSGLGHYKGMAVFVPNTITGDEITAHIVKVKSNYAFARLDELLVASPDRTEPDCPVFLQCGGCAFRHITYEAELKIKENHVRDTLKRIGRIEVEPELIIGARCPEHYRNKAQYPVEKNGDALKIGFYAAHSHRVIDCRSCLLQPKEFDGILEVFNNWILQYGIPLYNAANRTGLLRHIYIRRAEKTGEIMVCAVMNGRDFQYERELISTLLDKEPNIKSIVINKNKADTNVILGEKCKTIWGQDFITDELCGLKFQISPLSFYQVNPEGAKILYEKAAEYAALTGKETVLDLYCGAGSIGLTLAAKAKEIIGVEIVPRAVADAKTNAQINGIKNARFICSDANEAAQILEQEGTKPDVVVLDPPRKGCAADLLQTIAKMEPGKIVYVSCDPATLARDCAVLSELGYKVQKVAPVDMFPRTGHSEVVVSLRRDFASR
ncbi:MAG: 23S rRNA (uracil(1939)-C(5))-methyltransferase RlmD [Eubacteriales bacterium]